MTSDFSLVVSLFFVHILLVLPSNNMIATLPEHCNADNDKPKRVKDYFRRIFWVQSTVSLPRPDDNDCNRDYAGSGTQQDPYLVDYLQDDPQDAMRMSKGRRYTIALVQAVSFFAVTFGSSVYASGIPEIRQDFRVSDEVATLGLALYVLGFALGPIIWSPLSEVYGRRPIFVVSYTVYIAFTVAAPFASNITALIVIRFFASAFGSSAQTIPGGMIADLFSKNERGPVMALFAACPFLGPAFGV